MNQADPNLLAYGTVEVWVLKLKFPDTIRCCLGTRCRNFNSKNMYDCSGVAMVACVLHDVADLSPPATLYCWNTKKNVHFCKMI
jgi:hypothetical protein